MWRNWQAGAWEVTQWINTQATQVLGPEFRSTELTWKLNTSQEHLLTQRSFSEMGAETEWLYQELSGQLAWLHSRKTTETVYQMKWKARTNTHNYALNSTFMPWYGIPGSHTHTPHTPHVFLGCVIPTFTYVCVCVCVWKKKKLMDGYSDIWMRKLRFYKLCKTIPTHLSLNGR